MDKNELKELKKGNDLKVGPNLVCSKGKHEFVYQSGTEIVCLKCPVGYPVGPGINLKDGKLTIHGEELVI